MSYDLTVQIKASYQAAGKGQEDPFARAILSVPLQILWFAATPFPDSAGNIIVPTPRGTKQQYFS